MVLLGVAIIFLERVMFFFAPTNSVSLKREREREFSFFLLERVEIFLLRWLSFISLFTELSFSFLEGVELDFLMSFF